MGLIKKGIECGTVYAIANKGLQTYDKHEANKQQQRTIQNSQEVLQAPPVYQNPGFVHQPFCNGQCSGQCGGAANKDVSEGHDNKQSRTA